MSMKMRSRRVFIDRIIKCIARVFILLAIVCCMSACMPSINIQTITATPSHDLFVDENESTKTSLDLDTPLLTTPTAITVNTETNVIALDVTNIPQPMTNMQMEECPKIILDEELIASLEGSILFGTGLLKSNYADPFTPQKPGIWAISANKLESQLVDVLSETSSSWAYLADDENILLYIDRSKEDTSQSKAIFYDLRNKEELWQTDGPSIILNVEWLANGRVKLLVHEERIWETGIRREYLLLDPKMKQAETLIEEISLPGYQFNEEVEPHGYASINPSGDFALYSANADVGVDIRLLNLVTGEIVWSQNSRALPGPIQPSWTKDGNYVLFYIYDLVGEDVYVKILRLGIDGQLEDLPDQPYPQLNPSTFVDFLASSPDQRYIIYRAGWQNPAGFVVDTLNSQIGEICEPDTTFIDGQWIANDLFLYRVMINKDDQATHVLRILDLASWTTQNIFETETGYGINVFGWTSIEIQ